MKIKGVDLSKAYEDFIVLPRKPEDVVITARAVASFEEFLRLCPAPVPPTVRRAGAKRAELNFDDKEYRRLVNEQNARQLAWINIQSLKATPGLEWETVKDDDPKTWTGYLIELQKAFSPMEIVQIMRLCDQVNGLNEEHLKAARERFLSGNQSEEISSDSQKDAQ